MTVELADYLISLDKYIVLDGQLKDQFLIDIQYPMKFRIELSSPEDLDQTLLVDIWESDKKALKISLHHQDNSTQNGLLRVDYNGRHQNPPEINDSLPEKFHPFVGKWLDDYNGHIHYVVDGFKPLVWALPLEKVDFPVKKLNGREDYANTLQAFFNEINLRTEVKFNTQMRIA